MSDFSECKILVVDDEESNITILLKTLGDDYEVSVAIDGQSAWELAQNNPPDIILLDIIMPDVDGYQVCQQLKAEPKTRDIPIIFVTAMDNELDEAKGLKLGAVDYITKPIQPEIVKARVKNHLELKIAREKLQKHNQQLQAILQLREEMANMIVHDMRTPLSSILGFCELVFFKKHKKSKILSFLRNIQSSATQLNSFLNDLLVIAKSEHKKLLLHKVPADIKQIFHTTKELSDGFAQSKGIALKCEYPDTEIPTIELDIKLFQRVLDNLTNNALKYATSAVILQAEYFPAKKSLHIKICDDGMGIPEEEQTKIFESFTVGKNQQDHLPKIGLGLAFCKKVIEAHGGRIWVTNNQPQGACFVIEIC